jgi:hypothetical protein
MATVYGQLAMAAAEAGALGGPPAGGTDCPGRLATRVRSCRAQVSGRGLACSAISDKLEKELLSLIEANHAGAFDRADMHEDVLAAVIRLDESEALLAVEPLYSSCSHIASSSLSETSRLESQVSTQSWNQQSSRASVRVATCAACGVNVASRRVLIAVAYLPFGFGKATPKKLSLDGILTCLACLASSSASRSCKITRLNGSSSAFSRLL